MLQISIITNNIRNLDLRRTQMTKKQHFAGCCGAEIDEESGEKVRCTFCRIDATHMSRKVIGGALRGSWLDEVVLV